MKTLKLKKIPTAFIAIAAIFMVLSMSSCSHKVSFQTSSIAPAARGTVQVKKDKNNNYGIHVSITNLSEPKRLTPAKQTYVVWAETPSGVKNIGKMNSSSSILSKTLKASLNAVSVEKPTRIFVTAEDSDNISFPGSLIILTTDSF